MSLLYLPDEYLLGMLAWLAAGAVGLFMLLRLRRRWRDRAGRVRVVHGLLSAWMVLAALTGLELYFALLYDQTDSFNMTNVSRKWFDMHVRPQQRTLSFSDGQVTLYRDAQEFPAAVPPDARHVCFVGDSFTFGHGIRNVADRFSDRVAADLERTHPGGFVVSNLSDAGRDLHWVALLLQKLFGDGHRIDTVVYVVCLNDIETFDPGHETFYQDLGGLGPSSLLFRDTYFFNFLWFRLRQYTMPEVRGYYSFVKDYYAGAPWQRMQELLDRVRDLCAENGAELRVVVFPFLHNLGPEYDFQEAHEGFSAWAREAGVATLDLLPVLTPHAHEGLTVNRFDAHPNERAHELAAEALRDWLVDPSEPQRP